MKYNRYIIFITIGTVLFAITALAYANSITYYTPDGSVTGYTFYGNDDPVGKQAHSASTSSITFGYQRVRLITQNDDLGWHMVSDTYDECWNCLRADTSGGLCGAYEVHPNGEIHTHGPGDCEDYYGGTVNWRGDGYHVWQDPIQGNYSGQTYTSGSN